MNVDLRQAMQMSSFVVLGDTVNEEKYAYKIKNELIRKGYKVQCVGKELSSINDTEGEIDVIDLCIHPVKGLKLLKECKKSFKTIIIQPGASDVELVTYLRENKIPFIDACVLVGLKLYSK